MEYVRASLWSPQHDTTQTDPKATATPVGRSIEIQSGGSSPLVSIRHSAPFAPGGWTTPRGRGARVGRKIESPWMAKPEELAKRSREPPAASAASVSSWADQRSTRSATEALLTSIRASPWWTGSEAHTWDDPTTMPRDPSGPGAWRGLPRSLFVRMSFVAMRVTTPESDHAQAPPASAASSFAHGTDSSSRDWMRSAAAGVPSVTFVSGRGALVSAGASDPDGPAATADGDAGTAADRPSPHGFASATITNATTTTRTTSQRRPPRGGPSGSGSREVRGSTQPAWCGVPDASNASARDGQP